MMLQSNRLSDRQTDKQTDRQTDTFIYPKRNCAYMDYNKMVGSTVIMTTIGRCYVSHPLYLLNLSQYTSTYIFYTLVYNIYTVN